MRTEGLNILFVTAHFPYPLIGGERIKQYNLLKRLAKKNKVVLISFDRGHPVSNPDIEKVKALGIEVYLIRLKPAKAYLNCIINSPLGGPMEKEFFRDSAFGETINMLIKRYKFNLIINFFIRTAEYVRYLDIPKILIAEDCRSHYQVNTSNAGKNIKEKLIRSYEYRKLIKYEQEIVNDFDIITFVTKEDIENMIEINPYCHYKLLTNGVDTEKFLPGFDNTRNGLLFVGKLDVYVNKVMVFKIIEEILPKVLSIKPDVHLNIVGYNPPANLKKIKSRNFSIIENSPDIVSFYQKSSIFLHPHEGGSGIQNKVLEAMSCGCMVVTTTTGARGINISNGINGFVCKEQSDFIETVITLLDNNYNKGLISAKARKTVKTGYSWNSVFQQLNKIIAEL